MKQEIVITDTKNTGKLLRVIQKTVPDISAAFLFKLLRKGKVRLNNRKIREHTVEIRVGDVITIDDIQQNPGKNREQRNHSFEPEILFEDSCLFVINKPQGIPVHSGAGKTNRNVIDMLNAGSKGALELFLVHRLDRFTSGVLILAKSRKDAGKLQDIIKSDDEKKISKFYSGIVFGKLPEKGVYDGLLDGKSAITQYKRKKIRKAGHIILSEADIRIKTGKKHQIRRHFAEAGYPVAGDEQYGNWQLNRQLSAVHKTSGPLLHCRRIVFLHPVSNMMMDISAPEPEEFQVIMKAGFHKLSTKVTRDREGKNKKSIGNFEKPSI